MKTLVLKSGFLSLSSEEEFQYVPFDKVNDLTQNAIYFNNSNIFGNKPKYNKEIDYGPYFFNTVISKQFELFNVNNNYISDFNIRENILIEAKKCFGTRSIHEWCSIQSKSPFFTTSHYLYIEDTLNFIKTGKRKHSTFSWGRLLDKTTPNENQKLDKDYKNLIEKMFSDMSGDNVELFSKWVSHPGGFKDFFIFLYLVFGRD